MLEVCPLCGQSLRNGMDGPNKIRYTAEDRKKFDAGEITLEELNDHAEVYYERARLCFNSGNENTLRYGTGENEIRQLNPPCANFYGVRGGTIENPDVVVETITIIDN